jgi:hypothetical protein
VSPNMHNRGQRSRGCVDEGADGSACGFDVSGAFVR